MPTVYEGHLISPAGARYAIVAARFNDAITRRLLDGALDAFTRHGADDVEVAWVPGAFEVPLVAQRLAASGRYAGVVCLGAVIRGATGHYDVVVNGVASGCQQVALADRRPGRARRHHRRLDRAGVGARRHQGRQQRRRRRPDRHRDGLARCAPRRRRHPLRLSPALPDRFGTPHRFSPASAMRLLSGRLPRRLVAAALALASLPAFAQPALGAFEAYPAYNEISAITSGLGRLWAAAPGGIFSYDPVSGEIARTTTIDGLRGGDVQSLAVDEARGTVWAGYADGVLDRITTEDGSVRTYFDIERNAQFASRGVRRLRVLGDSLYAATDFGLVVFDLTRSEVRNTYARFGSLPPATPTSDFLFAPLPDGTPGLWLATDAGVVYAPAASPTLQSPAGWTLDPGFAVRAIALALFDGGGGELAIYVAGGSSSARDVYVRACHRRVQPRAVHEPRLYGPRPGRRPPADAVAVRRACDRARHHRPQYPGRRRRGAHGPHDRSAGAPLDLGWIARADPASGRAGADRAARLYARPDRSARPVLESTDRR